VWQGAAALGLGLTLELDEEPAPGAQGVEAGLGIVGGRPTLAGEGLIVLVTPLAAIVRDRR
jgi:hypothetical protein